MVEALDSAIQQNRAEEPAIPPFYHSSRGHTSIRCCSGRPQLDISKDILEMANSHLDLTQIAQLANCSARTIRRRLLDLGLAESGQPVFATTRDSDGNMVWIRTSTTPRRRYTVTDEQLDVLMHDILTTFPNFGQQMIAGHLSSNGQIVSRERIRQSYRRVHGAPACFGRRRIQRREYSVAGPNALWHHDGQHGKWTASR